MKKSFIFLLTAISIWKLLLLSSCANIIPPVGGAKDSLPPVLVKANPPQETKNFKGNYITLQFNEYVELQNVFENILIAPAMEKFPIITYRLKNVHIKIKDTLYPSTTYCIQFGNAIKDVNEGNIFKNLKYVFSTGDTIDSLSLEGHVQIAETGKVDSTLIVMLYDKLYDSAVAKEKPRYIARLDGKGHFKFDYLPGGTFHIFALKDDGFKKYTSKKSLFAFADAPVIVGADNQLVQLLAFAAEKDIKNSTPASPGTKSSKEDKRLKYTTSLENNEHDLLSKDITIQFNQPLKQFDTTKFILADTQYHAIQSYNLQLDSTGKILSIQYPWKEKQAFKLIVFKDAATDTAGNTLNKNDTISFKIKPETAYGSVRIRFTGIALQKHPVLQWIQGDNIYKSYPITGGEWKINLFLPQTYELRILYDINGNGIWDTGDYWTKKQPEKVIALEEKFQVRANWENEFNISL